MLSNWLRNLVTQASTRAAVAGNGAGALDVPSRSNWIYVRLGDANGETTEIRTSTIHPNYDDFILIARDHPMRPGAWRMIFWLRDGSDATLPAPIVGSIYERFLLLDSDAIQLTDSDGNYLEE